MWSATPQRVTDNPTPFDRLTPIGQLLSSNGHLLGKSLRCLLFQLQIPNHSHLLQCLYEGPLEGLSKNKNLEAGKEKSEMKRRLLCWQFLSDPLQRCDSVDSCGSCHPHFKLSVLQIKFRHEKAKYHKMGKSQLRKRPMLLSNALTALAVDRRSDGEFLFLCRADRSHSPHSLLFHRLLFVKSLSSAQNLASASCCVLEGRHLHRRQRRQYFSTTLSSPTKNIFPVFISQVQQSCV